MISLMTAQVRSQPEGSRPVGCNGRRLRPPRSAGYAHFTLVMVGWSFESGENQGRTISNIEQGMMNFEGKSRIDEPVLQAQGPLILHFIIRSSLFDIRYSFLSWSSSRRKTHIGLGLRHGRLLHNFVG
jgi:hypothetical protein